MNAPPSVSLKSPFHPSTPYRSNVLFNFNFLKNLTFLDVIVIVEDFQLYTTRRHKLQFKSRLVAAYHIPFKSCSDGEVALYELLLRLMYELLSGYISINDLRYETWHRSCHRDARHNERVRRLLDRIHRSRKALYKLRRIHWLSPQRII